MIASINIPITVRKLHEIVVLLYLVKFSFKLEKAAEGFYLADKLSLETQ